MFVPEHMQLVSMTPGGGIWGSASIFYNPPMKDKLSLFYRNMLAVTYNPLFIARKKYTLEVIGEKEWFWLQLIFRRHGYNRYLAPGPIIII